MSTLPREVARFLPIFKVWADDGKHPSVALNRPVCVIGRREGGVNLPLQAPEVSKLHALVVRTQRRVYVRDLASRNGVQRNGAPVQEVGLSDEDVLRIGSYTLRCASGFGPGDTGLDESGAGGSAASLPPAELTGADGATYPFPSGQQTLLIGRRDGCDLRFDDDERVAPVHAILFEMDGKRYVRDLDAPSGTILNGQTIHQAELNSGDELRVGGVTLRYSQADAAADSDAAAARDALDMSDSSLPGIDLVDSATSASGGANDSLIMPEITMEDSQSPAPASAAGKPPRPISEYDFDVVEPDARRESTFAGEIVADVPASAPAPAPTPMIHSEQEVMESKPSRPEQPPMTAAPAAAPGVGASPLVPPGNDDASIPISGSFHDAIFEDHVLQDVGANPVAGDNGAPRVSEAQGPKSPPEPSEISAEANGDRSSPAVEAEADAVDPAEEAITQLVDEVAGRVDQMSAKVEQVAAKVERVAMKMSEVTKEVGEVAQTTETLQEAWSDFRGGGEGEVDGGASDSGLTPDGVSNTKGKRRQKRLRKSPK